MHDFCLLMQYLEKNKKHCFEFAWQKILNQIQKSNLDSVLPSGVIT